MGRLPMKRMLVARHGIWHWVKPIDIAHSTIDDDAEQTVVELESFYFDCGWSATELAKMDVVIRALHTYFD